ncbi:MAG: threonine/homoserine/homoserine lactone efflux protein [Cyclobacteriaceae bacterium]
MILLTCFFVGLFFSFIGSIPPGTINITTMQYAMSNKKAAAISFAAAAALTEYFYAGIAVKFQMYLTENTSFSSNFQLVPGTVLIILGILNLVKQKFPDPKPELGEKRNAFKKGVLVSLANPMAIPFWLAVTVYLQGMNWVDLSGYNYLIYVAGISTGTFLLLAVVTQLGARFAFGQRNKFIVYRVPGIIFLAMGVYTFLN